MNTSSASTLSPSPRIERRSIHAPTKAEAREKPRIARSFARFTGASPTPPSTIPVQHAAESHCVSLRHFHARREKRPSSSTSSLFVGRHPTRAACQSCTPWWRATRTCWPSIARRRGTPTRSRGASSRTCRDPRVRTMGWRNSGRRTCKTPTSSTSLSPRAAPSSAWSGASRESVSPHLPDRAENGAPSSTFPRSRRLVGSFLAGAAPNEGGSRRRRTFHQHTSERSLTLPRAAARENAPWRGADEAFGRRIPFAFLEDVKSAFAEAHTEEEVRVALAYSFNAEFSRVLSQKMERYSGGGPVDAMSRVRDEISEVKNVMVRHTRCP